MARKRVFKIVLWVIVGLLASCGFLFFWEMHWYPAIRRDRAQAKLESMLTEKLPWAMDADAGAKLESLLGPRPEQDWRDSNGGWWNAHRVLNPDIAAIKNQYGNHIWHYDNHRVDSEDLEGLPYQRALLKELPNWPEVAERLLASTVPPIKCDNDTPILCFPRAGEKLFPDGNGKQFQAGGFEFTSADGVASDSNALTTASLRVLALVSCNRHIEAADEAAALCRFANRLVPLGWRDWVGVGIVRRDARHLVQCLAEAGVLSAPELSELYADWGRHPFELGFFAWGLAWATAREGRDGPPEEEHQGPLMRRLYRNWAAVDRAASVEWAIALLDDHKQFPIETVSAARGSKDPRSRRVIAPYLRLSALSTTLFPSDCGPDKADPAVTSEICDWTALSLLAKGPGSTVDAKEWAPLPVVSRWEQAGDQKRWTVHVTADVQPQPEFPHVEFEPVAVRLELPLVR